MSFPPPPPPPPPPLLKMTTPAPFPILIFTKTTSYRHTSIPSGLALFQRLATQHPYITLTTTEDSGSFAPSTLRSYCAIVLLQTLGPALLSSQQLSAFRDWVQRGGGVVAIHGAAAGMPEDGWWAKMIGAKFLSHPDPEMGSLVLDSDKTNEHFILSGCGGRQGWKDEWYNFHEHPRENGGLEVLLRGDTRTFSGGMHGEDHPLVWCQEFEGGRVFFTALGHFDEAYEDDWFSGMVERGLSWVARREGELKK